MRLKKPKKGQKYKFLLNLILAKRSFFYLHFAYLKASKQNFCGAKYKSKIWDTQVEVFFILWIPAPPPPPPQE